MVRQPFDAVRGELLEGVERLVVADHRGYVERVLGQPWSAPLTYRWMRYEDPDPVARLLVATAHLEALWDNDDDPAEVARLEALSGRH